MAFTKLRITLSLVSLLTANLLTSAVVQADIDCLTGAGKVARGIFTTQIVNREPVDHVLILENNTRELYFFTDLRQFEGHTITHRWEFGGAVVVEKTFEVKGPRWRVYSRAELPPDYIGRWTVVVLDEKGCAHKAVVFEYVQRSMDGPGPAILSLPTPP